MNGPVVYCLEEVDNGADLFALSVCKTERTFEMEYSKVYGLNTFSCEGVRTMPAKGNPLYALSYPQQSVRLKFIPYYAFANREESDMLVWLNSF